MERLLFDLGTEETFVPVEWVYKGKTRQAKHYFGQPTTDIAEQYLKNMNRIQRAVDGNVIETEFDSTDADLELWRQLKRRVEGYVVPGIGDIMIRKDWDDLVPITHKQAAAQAIFFLGVQDEEATSKDDGSTIELGFIEVRLKASQNGKLIKNLYHQFRDPTPSELREWNQMHALSKVELRRKERNYLFESILLREIKIYDAMFRAVDGYAFKGEPLAKMAVDLGILASMMNAVHKQFAITRAFEMVKAREVEQEKGPLGAAPSAGGSGS